MSYESHAAKLHRSLDYQWCVRFVTDILDSDSAESTVIDGIVAHIGEDFFALWQESDFEIDGMFFLRPWLIRDIRDDEHDECCNNILRQNGQIERLRLPDWLGECELLSEALQAMMSNDVWPAMVHGDETENLYYIGSILSVSAETICVKCYDAIGNWGGEFELDVERLLRIDLDTRYCKHFNNYIRDKNNLGR